MDLCFVMSIIKNYFPVKLKKKRRKVMSQNRIDNPLLMHKYHELKGLGTKNKRKKITTSIKKGGRGECNSNRNSFLTLMIPYVLIISFESLNV